MADLIDRRAAIDALEVKYMSFGIYREQRAASQCIDAIKNLPSAQPEIVRCKDCKHYRSYAGYIDGCCHMAEWYKRYQYEDDFCSRAERRTDE